MSEIKPNVVLIGAAKAGTTSLYNYLLPHPQVFLPRERKEINYLAGVNQTVHSEEEYLSLYKSAASYPVRMDISTSYIYEKSAAQKIKAFLGPDVKVVAFLRNPVEASHSLWKQMRHYGGETLSFEAALDAETARRNDPMIRASLSGWDANYFYTDRYIYAPQLQRYYDVFPAAQIKIFIYEEFFNDLERGWKELCAFLDISSGFRPSNFGSVYNPAAAGRKSELIHNLIHKQMAVKKLVTWAIPEKTKTWLRIWLDDVNKKHDTAETLSGNMRKQLKDVFKNDVRQLERLLNKSLEKSWLDSYAETNAE